MKYNTMTRSNLFSQICINRKRISSFMLLMIPFTLLFAGETPPENEAPVVKCYTGDLPRHLHETTSVVVLTEEDFNQGNHTNIWQLIQGRAPGMWITLDGGAPGAQGFSNMGPTTGQPLIVIDGLPQDPRFASGMRDPLNFLNPRDVESVTLLTGGAASALYGIRGGNGVIVIRTKRAQQGEPLAFAYSTHLSVAQPGNQVDVLDAANFRQLVLQRFSDQPNVTGLMGEASTYWQDEIFSNAFSQSHNLSASGSVAQIPWRASIHYNDHAGVLNTDNLKRLGGQINLQPSLLDDHLRFNIKLHTSQLENRIAPRQAIGHAIGFDPTQTVRDPESIFGGYFAWTNNGLPIPVSPPNPVAMLNQTQDFNTTQTLGINANVDYTLHFFPDITLGISLYEQTMSTERENFISDQATWRYFAGGQYDLNEDTYTNQMLEGRINFNRQLPAINSRIDMTAAISRQDFDHEYTLFQSNIENNMAGEPYMIFVNGRGASMRQLVSMNFGAGYAFKDLYHLSYVFRNDRASVFLSNMNSFGYHSVAAAWKMHNESFWPEDFFLSKLKIHTAFGQSGNMDFPTGQELPFGIQPFISMDIQPEKFNSFNAALDYGLWGNRLTGCIRYFTTEQSELFFPLIIPSGANLSSYVLTNTGTIEHKGWEFSLGAALIKSEPLSWNIAAHLTTRQSHVKELIKGDPDFYGIDTGMITGAIGNNIFILREGYSPGSFFVFQSVYSTDGYPLNNLYIDQNNDGMITDEDRTPFKSPYPDLFMGISSHLQFKNWRLSMAGTLVSGNYAYNNTASYFGNYAMLYRSAEPNLGNITTEALQLNLDYPQYLSDYFVQNASYFRMDYIHLAYHFINLTARNFNLELSATVQNAFVITNYSGPEPEVPSGIDFNPYPRPRMFTLGVKVGF